MNGRAKITLALVALLAAACNSGSGESRDTGSAEAESRDASRGEGDLGREPVRRFLVGVAPVPRQFPGSSAEDWQDLLNKLPEVAEVVTAQDGAWRTLSENGLSNSLVAFVGDNKDVYHFVPMFGINYCDADALRTQGTLDIDWTLSTDKVAYRRLAVEICKEYNAKYLALAIENNFHYKYRPQDYDTWVAAYKEAYAEIKRACPTTKIFVTFQYELLRGLGKQYWGSVRPQWELLDKFGDKLDLVVFTSYPNLEYAAVNDIPADYYAEAAKHTNRKVAFAEVAWEKDDGTFVAKLATMMESLDVEFALWSFMHDTKLEATRNPFPEIGLRTYDGAPKAAWYSWADLKRKRYTGTSPK